MEKGEKFIYGSGRFPEGKIGMRYTINASAARCGRGFGVAAAKKRYMEKKRLYKNTRTIIHVTNQSYICSSRHTGSRKEATMKTNVRWDGHDIVRELVLGTVGTKAEAEKYLGDGVRIEYDAGTQRYVVYGVVRGVPDRDTRDRYIHIAEDIMEKDGTAKRSSLQAFYDVIGALRGIFKRDYIRFGTTTSQIVADTYADLLGRVAYDEEAGEFVVYGIYNADTKDHCRFAIAHLLMCKGWKKEDASCEAQDYFNIIDEYRSDKADERLMNAIFSPIRMD